MSLRFGTYTEFQCPPGRDHAELIWDVIEVGVQADQLGYSVFTCLEHPWFEQFAINPFPLGVFCTLAERTRNIRFRTLCHTLPLYNPMVLAGQIAQADILLHGRLDVGVGTRPRLAARSLRTSSSTRTSSATRNASTSSSRL